MKKGTVVEFHLEPEEVECLNVWGSGKGLNEKALWAVRMWLYWETGKLKTPVMVTRDGIRLFKDSVSPEVWEKEKKNGGRLAPVLRPKMKGFYR